MDIAEHRLPQDGRFSVVSNTHPLDHSQLALRLDRIGMNELILKSFNDMIHRPQGMILITGPTGSGKSSTLYAALATLVETGRNVITIENPVEYAIAGANQGQTN